MHISYINANTWRCTNVFTLLACLLDEFNDCTHTGWVNREMQASYHFDMENKIIKYTLHIIFWAFTNISTNFHLVMSHFIIVNPPEKEKHFAYVTELI